MEKVWILWKANKYGESMNPIKRPSNMVKVWLMWNTNKYGEIISTGKGQNYGESMKPVKVQ